MWLVSGKSKTNRTHGKRIAYAVSVSECGLSGGGMSNLSSSELWNILRKLNTVTGSDQIKIGIYLKIFCIISFFVYVRKKGI